MTVIQNKILVGQLIFPSRHVILEMITTKKKELTQMFYNFVNNKRPLAVSQTLRRVLFGYLSFEMQAGVTTDLRDEIEIMSDLMDILDYAEQISGDGPHRPA